MSIPVVEPLDDHMRKNADGAVGVIRRYAGRRAVLGLTLFLVCLPFISAVISIAFGHIPYARTGDGALIQIAVSDAEHFHELLGTYSRCGWHDPGPAWFYLLVPVYVLGGSNAGSLEVSSLFLQCVSLCLCLLTASWGRGRMTVLGCAAVICVYEWALPSYVFTTIWNPFFLIGPALLMLLLCARAAAGSWPAWCGAVLCATIVIQAHVGLSYFAAGLVFVSGAASLLAARRAARDRFGQAAADRRRLGLGLGALAASAALWVPPLVEQTSYSDGNISQLIAFAKNPMANNMCTGSGATNTPHGLSESLSVTEQGVTLFPFTHQLAPVLTGSASATSVLMFLCYLAAAGALAFFAFRGGERLLGWTGALSTLGLVLLVYTTMHANGPLGFYLVVWYSILPVAVALGWAALAARGARRLGGPPGELLRRPEYRGAYFGIASFAALVALIVATPNLVRQADAGDYQQPAVDITKLVLGRLPAKPAPGADKRVLVVVGSHDSWGVVANTVLELRHRGWDPQVTPNWEFMFGHRYQETRGVPHYVFTLSFQATQKPPAGSTNVGSVLYDQALNQTIVVYEQTYDPSTAPAWYPAPPTGSP